MKELESKIRTALGNFYNTPFFLEKLSAMVVGIAGDDQRYVPGYLLKQLDRGDHGYEFLKVVMREYFEPDDAPVKRSNVENSIFRPLPETAAFVLSNAAIAPLAIETAPSVFQDFFLKLSETALEDCGFTKVILFYGVAMALFEWRDRQRSIPYDTEIHGPITLAMALPKKSE